MRSLIVDPGPSGLLLLAVLSLGYLPAALTWTIAYLLGPRFWGHGYATAATADLITRLPEPQVGTVWACVHPGNVPSTRVLSRLGFHHQPASSGRRLLSYDPGDLVFSLPLS